MRWLAKHASQEDAPNCSGFQAYHLANLKNAKGLRVSGVTGVCCARHGCLLPNGLGDLTKGEKYVFALRVILMTFMEYQILFGRLCSRLGLSTSGGNQEAHIIRHRMHMGSQLAETREGTSGVSTVSQSGSDAFCYSKVTYLGSSS